MTRDEADPQSVAKGSPDHSGVDVGCTKGARLRFPVLLPRLVPGRDHRPKTQLKSWKLFVGAVDMLEILARSPEPPERPTSHVLLPETSTDCGRMSCEAESKSGSGRAETGAESRTSWLGGQSKGLNVNNGQRPLPRHVAIIMDGNGRWAKARGKQRIAGHREGATAVRHVVETASRIGIEYLTLYAFSTNNWARPTLEVEALMGLMVDFARSERAELRQNGIRVKVIGDVRRLPPRTRTAIDELMLATKDGSRMTLTLALSYGARQDVINATKTIAELVKQGQLDPSTIDEATIRRAMTTRELPDVDLLIRTGGESRVSDFLLIESAYAELLFLPIMWPEFRPDTLHEAVDRFMGRERRFGLISEQLDQRVENESHTPNAHTSLQVMQG
jgi:undecaprenyl diphosphate synthase